jgi:hypothetical protein
LVTPYFVARCNRRDGWFVLPNGGASMNVTDAKLFTREEVERLENVTAVPADKFVELARWELRKRSEEALRAQAWFDLTGMATEEQPS